MEETKRIVGHWHTWALPSHGLKVETIDAHVGGQPLRLVLSGFPEPRGVGMVEKCRYVMEHCEHLRGAVILEPRGHADMYACVLTAPQRLESHFGALFLHRSGISPMSGHGIIALTTLCIEAGLVEMKAPETLLKIDTPAGLVRAFAHVADDRVKSVFFENVPSFVVGMDKKVAVPGLGEVRFDMAYGGEFYAFVNAADIGLTLLPENLMDVARAGATIGEAIEQAHPVQHPIESVLSLLSGVIFVGAPTRKREGQADFRQVCVYTDGSVDRSPSGTGLSGRLALMVARHEIDLGDPVVAEGILGTKFSGKAAKDGVEVGPYSGIIAEIEGAASLTGRHSFFIDPDDALGSGFVV